MFALLKKLGVPRNVRLFFEPYFQVCNDGSLKFTFGSDFEHFHMAFHRVPLAVHPWVAGQGGQLFYSFSAMEAVAFLSLHLHRFPNLSDLRFVAVGCQVAEPPAFAFHRCALLFGQNLTGHLTAIRYSAALRNKMVTMTYEEGNVQFQLSGKNFTLPGDVVTLHAFEKATGLRSGFRTYQPRRPYQTFLQQLIYQL